jgi:radical SAM superfamily enzyme YgiQ (UPF0313 family)
LKKVTKIFLADLAHTYSVRDASLLTPLNIGYIKAYAVAAHGDNVDITLFKHPEKLLSQIKEAKPDIIGFSNYGWNENLNRSIGGYIRKVLPNSLIVAGGPNIDPDPLRRLAFLDRHQYLDFLVIDGGEEPFSELITWWREGNHDNGLLPQNIVWRDGNKIIASGERPLKKTIDNIPSPYLSGYLDEFLEAGMIPMFESNRGCPYLCTFCAWGSASKNKVSRFELDTTLAEVDYVGKRTQAKNWIFCDANFGILPRDIEIAKAIRHVRDTTGYPFKCHIWLAKNVTERNIEIGEILGDMIIVFMSVQSLNEQVLKNIKRSNISLDTYVEYHNKFRNIGSDTFSELIIPMGGENKKSHEEALRELFDIGVDIIYNHNIRLLAGAETNSTETREEFGFKTRYRLIHGDAGIYKCPDGTALRAFEYEESVRKTKTFVESELFYFRKLHFLIDFCWNLNIYKPLLKAAHFYGINPLDVFHGILKDIDVPSDSANENQRKISEFFSRFDELSHSEWFDSAEDIENYFAEDANFQRLINQEFDKLNILFSVILLKEYKLAFDIAIKNSIDSFSCIPEAISKDVGALVSGLFPPMDFKLSETTVSFPDNLTELTKESVDNYVPSNKRKLVTLMETPKRREACELLLDTQGNTLSKVLNTRGVGSLFLRNLQMVPAKNADSLPLVNN